MYESSVEHVVYRVPGRGHVRCRHRLMPPLAVAGLLACLGGAACRTRASGDGGDGAAGKMPGAGDSAVTLTAVRTAVGAGEFERVVFTFAGSDLPGYEIDYAANRPVACGSGRHVDGSGDAYLRVRFRPARAHRSAAYRSVSVLDDRRHRPGGLAIRGLTMTCDFEGVVEWAVELDRRRLYSVRALDAPTRLVVDVQRDGSP